MEKESCCKRTEATEVVDSEGDEGNMLGVELGDNILPLSQGGGATLKFRADASQVGPCNCRDGRVGLLGEAAGNVRDSNVDADGDCIGGQ